MSKNYQDDDHGDSIIDTAENELPLVIHDAENEPQPADQPPVIQEPQPVNQPPVIQEPQAANQPPQSPQPGVPPNVNITPRGRGRGRGRPPGVKQAPKLVEPTSPHEFHVMPHLSPEVRRSTRVATKNKQ